MRLALLVLCAQQWRAEAPSRSSTGTVPERIAVADAGSQTTDDMIDVLTAEAIVAEASQVGDELAAKQAVAEHHASQLDCALSKAQAQLGRAEQRAKCENAAKEAAERRAAQRTDRQHGRQPSSEQQMRQLRAKLLRSVLVCAPIV